MTLADLRNAAAAALAEHAARCRRVDEFAPNIPNFKPEHRAALIGPFPAWAAYVAALGEPAPGSVTRAQLEVSLGSAKNMRAFALNILRIADAVDPVEVLQ